MEIDVEKKCREMIALAYGRENLRDLHGLDELNSVFRFAKVLIFYCAFFALYFWFVKSGNSYTLYFLLPMWLILLINFNRINVITHDAAHYAIFKNRKRNDLLTNFMVAYSALHDVMQYRKSHLLHHQYLHSAQDPDQEFYMLNARKVLEDLLLITFIKQLFFNSSKVKKSIFVYVYQLLILAVFFLIDGYLFDSVWHYLLFFAYPLLSVFVLVLRIRTHIQHYTEGDEIVTRTTVPAYPERLLIGQKMEYHLEHHLFPGIPYYNLEKLHYSLAKTLYKDPAFDNLITKTYFTDVH